MRGRRRRTEPLWGWLVGVVKRFCSGFGGFVLEGLGGCVVVVVVVVVEVKLEAGLGGLVGPALNGGVAGYMVV